MIIHSRNRPPNQIKTLNARIKEYAEQNGHTYLDYFSAMIDEKGFLRRDLTDDGIHANEKGYAVMVPLTEQAIAGAKRSKT